MKKLFYLFLPFPLFILSCSSDDDWEDVNVNNLIGRWQVSDVYTKVVNTNLPELTEELKIVTLMSTPIIEFREGGVFISGDRKAGEYYIDGKTIYMKIDDSYYEQFDNASMKGNSLKWDSDMRNQTQTIINSQYPYGNIMIYDYIVTMKADRK